jgi:hypothetical protein
MDVGAQTARHIHRQHRIEHLRVGPQLRKFLDKLTPSLINFASLDVSLALCAFGTVSAQGYRVDDLGALDGNTSWAWAINDRGDVAGWASLTASR